MSGIQPEYCIPTDYFFQQVINELRIYKQTHFCTWHNSAFLQNIYRDIANGVCDPSHPTRKMPFPTTEDGDRVVNTIYTHGFMLLKLAPELHMMLFVYIQLREKKLLQKKYDNVSFELEKVKHDWETEKQARKPVTLDEDDEEDEGNKKKTMPMKRSASGDDDEDYMSVYFEELNESLVIPFPCKKKPATKADDEEKEEETKKKQTDEVEDDDDDDEDEEDPGWEWLGQQQH